MGINSMPSPALAAMASVCGLPHAQYRLSVMLLERGRGRTEVSEMFQYLPWWEKRSWVSAFRTISSDSMKRAPATLPSAARGA